MDKMDRQYMPYSSVVIHSSIGLVMSAVIDCLNCPEDKTAEIEEKLVKLWMTDTNKNPVLPCLSVRTGFDLYLQAQEYPPDSEIIMTAVNIGEMAEIVRNQNLKIVSLDINIDTLEPKLNVLEMLITPRTKAIVLSHLYGRRINLKPIIALAKKHNLHVIEDCAESYDGTSFLGDPQSDIVLFSFGGIKFATSFGGGIAKIKDHKIYEKMRKIYAAYPQQTTQAYLKKVLKYGVLYSILVLPPFTKILDLVRQTGHDYKEFLISYIRSFPTDLINSIRQRPSPALLTVMLHRQENFDPQEIITQREKGDALLKGLTPEMWPIGTEVKYNDHWLFPVIVEDTSAAVKALASLGIDAYRGTTQLKLIEPDFKDKPIGPSKLTGRMISPKEHYPHEAKYLMDHIIYLPSSRFVPYSDIEEMKKLCGAAMNKLVDKKSREGRLPLKTRAKAKL